MTDKTKPHHVEMLDYEGSKLTRCKNKTGGKNNSDIDGFYEDKVSKRQYFVKKPVDQIELFAEAFAGAILQELIDRGIITEEEARSLIIAKVIKTDGGYALIQEKRIFRELFKLINTGNIKNSDRSPMIETLFGARKYKKLSDMPQSGLPIILMCAALLSAHSAHGGNTVFDDDKQLFARLDWGDAFRNLASPLNNKNILLSAESQGFLNVKWFTKNYIYKYRDVPGLFERVGQKGEAFKARLEQDDLNSIIAAALNRLPADLINAKQAKEFLAYAGMRSITIPLGKNANSDCEFVKEMATVLSVRLHKITGLAVKEPAPNSSAKQCDTEEYRRRLTKMVKINRYIKVIEKKAKDLDERGEIYAYDKANSLATNMKVLVEEFTTSGEDEQTALNQFKKEAKKYITEADKELGKHRRKWKHILANLGLAVMGLGVGYGVAALINHKVSGHYTFFDTTKSQKRTARLSHAVDDLEADDKTFIANRV